MKGFRWVMCAELFLLRSIIIWLLAINSSCSRELLYVDWAVFQGGQNSVCMGKYLMSSCPVLISFISLGIAEQTIIEEKRHWQLWMSKVMLA